MTKDTKNTVSFRVGENFKDGSLAERMEAEGLPIELLYADRKGERPTYTCSAELLLRIRQSGANIEFVGDASQELQKKVKLFGGRPTTMRGR